MPQGQLHSFDVNRYVHSKFRGDLNRVARGLGGMPSGWLIAALHGAYDPNTRTYPMHIHGLASGGKIEVIDALRDLPMYQPAVAGDGRDAARTPIVMSREPLVNLPSPISYILKSYAPLRPTRLATDGLRSAIPTRVKRIPEPAHTEYLRFLDRWTINQLTLVMGMHACDDGLVVR